MTKRFRDISVVICTYSEDRRPDLLRAVASVRNQLLKPIEVIVVVDRNEDLAHGLHAILPSDVTSIFNKGPAGLSGARNTGVQKARGEIVAFLDDDARAEPNWLSHLCTGFRRPEVAAVGGRIVADWPDPGRPLWFPEELDWVVGCTYAGLPLSSDLRVRNVIGCNMAFRRSVFERVGYFRRSLGRVGRMSGQAEETDLCLRLLRDVPGSVILYEPDAIVHHRVPGDRLTLSFLLNRSYNEGYWKARMRHLLSTRAEGPLTSEAMYLRHLLTRFLPDRLSRISRAHSLAQLGVAGMSVLAVGVGYLASELASVALRPISESRLAC